MPFLFRIVNTLFFNLWAMGFVAGMVAFSRLLNNGDMGEVWGSSRKEGAPEIERRSSTATYVHS